MLNQAGFDHAFIIRLEYSYRSSSRGQRAVLLEEPLPVQLARVLWWEQSVAPCGG
ncbi:hypothetical protein [Nitrosomonas sp. Is37]|uniref:hypothetical protein n=1 Tax=Nitrosomonas sp. Is37 TaxID=3080535 RepID=UPI00294B87EF|nr:hypothetical protein [Nitrosomonas sp. Is37]MDV6345302.1 hypothetical protein [Nitrosomonas sp. Is37]